MFDLLFMKTLQIFFVMDCSLISLCLISFYPPMRRAHTFGRSKSRQKTKSGKDSSAPLWNISRIKGVELSLDV